MMSILFANNVTTQVFFLLTIDVSFNNIVKCCWQCYGAQTID